MPKKSVEEYLAAPYSRVLIPDAESGTFTAEILELAGCRSQGSTPEEAYSNLAKAAHDWLVAAIESGHHIPEPLTTPRGYSGNVALRLPKSLHRRAVQYASRDGVSLNQYIVMALAERVGSAISHSSGAVRTATSAVLQYSTVMLATAKTPNSYKVN
ncbi:MAG: toxin-antitoxin system HicB family antitoxin [Thermoanaerobaculia bacterium]